LTEGTWAFREEFRSMKFFVRSFVYMQMHACVIWKLINVETRFLLVEIQTRLCTIHNGLITFGTDLMLRHHIGCFSELQEFAKASHRLLGCVYTVIRVSLVDRWKGERFAEASRHTNHSRRIAGARPLFKYCTSVVRRRLVILSVTRLLYIRVFALVTDRDYLCPQFPFHSHVVLYLVPNLYGPYLIFIPL
jgi:hypothetical protein